MAEPLPAFVARRRPDWDALQGLLDAQRTGKLHLEQLRTLDRLYRRAAADLAHAQAFYPATDAHRFVNQLCSTAYGAIYRPPHDWLTAVTEFFRRGFPRALRAELRFVAVSALLFWLGAALGALVVLFEPSGADLLVPPGVREAVADHRMWTDNMLSVMPPGFAASWILTNNLSVTIATFALGITLGLGTALILVSNGVQLGAVAALCVREGMGWPLLSFIGAHGVVELSEIIIAGGAGLMVGHALIDPGELPRGAFVKERATQAAKLVVGCAPFLALIGVVEGFISPGDLFPGEAKVALGLLLGALLWGYLLFAGREA